MSQDISLHEFQAFPEGHAYRAVNKCAECFLARGHAIHTFDPNTGLCAHGMEYGFCRHNCGEEG